MARIADLQVAGPALAADVDRAEVGRTGAAEVVEPLERLSGGSEHRPDEVRSGAGRGEHVREKEALGDLDALLVGQPALGLGGQLIAAGDEPRVALRGGLEQLVVAQRLREAVGELVIDRLGVRAQEPVSPLVGPFGRLLKAKCQKT